jgi:RNA polymerase sigma-70 factor, ECF subfamily
MNPVRPLVVPQSSGPQANSLLDLIRCHGSALLTRARRLLGDDGSARMVVQHVLVGAMSSGLLSTDEQRAWLEERVLVGAIAVHRQRPAESESIDRLLPQFQADGHHARTPRAAAGAAAAAHPEHVRAAIERLPIEHRLAVLLRDVEGIGADVAALYLGVDAETVRARLHQARLALCELLADGCSA